MAKNNQPRKVPDDIIEEIYCKWSDGVTLMSLAKEYKISIGTLSKYKRELKWDKRRENVQAIVTRKNDISLARRKVKRAKLGIKLQAEGLKSIKKGIKKQSDAIAAIRLGAEFEDQLYGDTDETLTIQIKLPKGTIVGNRPHQLTSDNE